MLQRIVAERIVMLQRFHRWLGGHSASQLAVLGALILFALWIVNNTATNLEQQNIASGFGFLNERTGFAISQHFLAYDEGSSYWRLLVVGLLNTLAAAVLGIVLASVAGLGIGILRLSRNYLLRQLAAAYVETLRNIPLLLQILFWYNGVLQALPSPRQSLEVAPHVFLSNRGLVFPAWESGPGGWLWFAAGGICLLAAGWMRWRQTQMRRLSGKAFRLWPRLLLIAGGAILVCGASVGWPFALDLPEFRGFNFVGGARLIPEFVALVLALGLYTGAFIAEIVRAGIEAVPAGQREAARALGLSRTQMLRFVILPQALRVIIPPLTSQYLNLTKNSSLGAAIAYPELVAVFAGTSLAQVGQAVEIISITMLIYLSLSLSTSYGMNRYNRYLMQHGGAP